MLLSCFIRRCRIRVQCVVVSDLSAFLPRSPVTLKWVGLKVLCRPLLYCISLKVGKCPGSEWCRFGTYSDIWLRWDGGGLAFGLDPAFLVLQSSCWLLTDFSLLNLKTKQTNRTNKKQQKAQQTWNISVDSGLKLTFKTSGGFPNALFCLSHCLVALPGSLCVPWAFPLQRSTNRSGDFSLGRHQWTVPSVKFSVKVRKLPRLRISDDPVKPYSEACVEY